MHATKQQLLERIEKFLELPGMCAGSHRATILEKCEKLSFEQLCEVSATLRIRAGKLASIVNSPERTQKIQDAKNSLDEFFAKYEIQP